MTHGHEQDQINETFKKEQRLRELVAQYLTGQIPYEEFVSLADKEGPHFDVGAMVAYSQKREFENQIESVIEAGKNMIHGFINLFHPKS